MRAVLSTRRRQVGTSLRAVEKHAQLIDFMLSDRRNSSAAYRFLGKALKTMSDYPLLSIMTDKPA